MYPFPLVMEIWTFVVSVFIWPKLQENKYYKVGSKVPDKNRSYQIQRERKNMSSQLEHELLIINVKYFCFFFFVAWMISERNNRCKKGKKKSILNK